MVHLHGPRQVTLHSAAALRERRLARQPRNLRGAGVNVTLVLDIGVVVVLNKHQDIILKIIATECENNE